MEAALHRRTVAVTRQGTPPLPRTGEGGGEGHRLSAPTPVSSVAMTDSGTNWLSASATLRSTMTA